MGNSISAPASEKWAEVFISIGCKPSLRKKVMSMSASTAVLTVRTTENAEVFIDFIGASTVIFTQSQPGRNGLETLLTHEVTVGGRKRRVKLIFKDLCGARVWAGERPSAGFGDGVNPQQPNGCAAEPSKVQPRKIMGAHGGEPCALVVNLRQPSSKLWLAWGRQCPPVHKWR